MLWVDSASLFSGVGFLCYCGLSCVVCWFGLVICCLLFRFYIAALVCCDVVLVLRV